MGNRCIDFQRFLGDTLLLLGRLKFKSTHVMQSVYQLNQNNTDILGHRNKYFSVIGSLILFFIFKFQSTDFGYCLIQIIDIFIKFSQEFFLCNATVFQYIMQKTSDNGFRSAIQLSQFVGNRNNVNEIRFT